MDINKTLEAVEALTQCDVVMVNAHLDTMQVGKETRYCVSGGRQLTGADLKLLATDYQIQSSRVERLEARLKLATEGLRYYADEENWGYIDGFPQSFNAGKPGTSCCGYDKAREVLAAISEDNDGK